MNTIDSQYDPSIKHPANYMLDDFKVDKLGRKSKQEFLHATLTQLFEQDTYSSRAVRNTCNFHIRNVRSAVCKSPEERTHNETLAMHNVFLAVASLNRRADEEYRKKKYEIAHNDDLSAMEKAYSLYELSLDAEKNYTPYPSYGKWMLSYRVLDEMLKVTNDPGYYGCTSQVNQQAIKKTIDSWKSYFAVLKDYRIQPWKYNGKPHEIGRAHV